jgi:hypothetical protein
VASTAARFIGALPEFGARRQRLRQQLKCIEHEVIAWLTTFGTGCLQVNK